jgi:preprotein translocase subunit SecD
VTVVPPDAAKKLEIEALITADYESTIEMRECEPGDPALAICFKVSGTYADSIKKAALENAVTTIRERIDNSGLAEPSVVQKDEQIIVELPGLEKDATASTRDLIARTAKLEFKVVDDGSTPGVNGRGTQFMAVLYNHVGSLEKEAALEQDRKENDPIEPVARQMGVYAMQDYWPVEDQPDRPHSDFFLKAYDRPNEVVPIEEAKKIGCVKKTDRARLATVDAQGNIRCDLKGWQIIQRYVDQAMKDPKFAQWGNKIPEDHQLGFEYEEPTTGDDRRPYWRSYYLWRAVRLTGTAITNAMGSFEPNSGRPIVLLDFNRFGGRVFGDLTAEIVGQKLATILDDKVKSAPIINGAIKGGRASITMGGADADRQLKDRDELVNVLKTGSLPAPLREESSSELGPTLGRDAIDKTKVSFGLGILLVVMIMVGIYRWSGWISVFGLVFHNLLTLAVMAVFGATLTLPGIAAIVLSVGMTVDGNILIYERIRDELQLGKSVRGAVDLGFSRAFSAILDGQLTTAAAGWVLLQYGSGPIKGFATLLLVGVFTTITCNIWVTRIFFDWYIAKKKGQLATISI